MADKKITALTDIGTGIGSTDIWMVVDGVATTPTNKKMTVSKFTGYFPSYLGFSQAPDAVTSASTVIDVTVQLQQLLLVQLLWHYHWLMVHRLDN